MEAAEEFKLKSGLDICIAYFSSKITPFKFIISVPFKNHTKHNDRVIRVVYILKEIKEKKKYDLCTEPWKGHADFKSFPQLNNSFPRHNYLEGTTN